MGCFVSSGFSTRAAGLILFWAPLSFFFTIDAGARGVILRFSAVDRVVTEGMHAKHPLMESVVK